MGTFWSITGSNYCVTDYFEIVKDDGIGGYTPTTDLAYLTNAPGNKGGANSKLMIR